MTIQKLPGTAITPGTITVVQLESTVATTVSTGGGPKITNLAITSNVNVTLDDTAVDLTGGFIRLTGTGFNTGCLVYAGLLPAASTTFISNTEVRAQLAAQTAGTYPVYLVNTDGGTAIRVPGVTYSASPAWQTASSLGDQYDGVLLNLSVVATDAVSYSVVSGSLPPGLSLNSNTGVISGTISGVVNDTVYTFTINAVDAQLQDSPRVFTINVTVSDPYFRLTTLLLTGNSGNTVVTDSSTNNFAITVVGDSRASNFSPYLTGWSNYFDGSSAYLSVADNAAFDFGADNFTIEYWEYRSSAKNDIIPIGRRLNTSGSATAIWNLGYESSGLLSGTFNDGAGTTYLSLQMGSAFYATWNHYAVVRNGNTVTCYRNGNSVGSGTLTQTLPAGNQPLTIGRMQNNGYYFQGYISNVRLIKGTALYTANFTPATSTLTSIANTSLLTCHANRLADSSTNNFAITRNGDVRIESFNPFNLTNTGTTGSVYFDGTGDYVLTISTTAMNLGANPFCLEMWFYLNSTGSTYYGLCGSQTDYKGPSISRYGSVLMYGLSSNGSSWNVMGAEGTTGSTTINPYQWYHLVLCRTGNTISAYVNGLRDATVASSATLISRTEGFCIGNWYAGLYPWNGYISSVRFVVGSNPYDATQTTLTIPAAPLTAIANTQLLTLQNRQPPNNHTFQDSSANNFLITRSGNATQGTFSPFSQTGWGNYFDGSGDYLTYGSNAAFTFGTGDFTVEAWVYITASASFSIFNVGGASTGSYSLYWWAPTQKFESVRYGDVGGATTNTYSINQWMHIAAVRSSGTSKLYINGVEDTGATYAMGNCSMSSAESGRIWQGSAVNNGYISNLRVVKSVAVYTGNFTVPTSPLTATQSAGTNIAAITTGQTSLLTCQSNRFVDNSTSPKTITPNGSPSVQAFSPYAPTATYSAATHGGSAYFDGTGDFLSLGNNNSFNFSGNFTVELWYYPFAYDDLQMFLTGVSEYQFGYSVHESRYLYYYGSSGNIIAGTPASSMLLNQWNHIVLVRSGTTLSIMSNGVRQGTATHSSSVNFSQTTTIAGYANNTPYYALRGYLAEFRAVNGVAVYDPTQTTYTVPTAPLTATTSTVLLLNFTNAGILDATGRNVIETVGDARTTSVITKWAGRTSMSFDGTGDYLAVPSSDFFKLFTDNFTIEAWIRFISVTNATFVTTNVISGLYWQYYSSALAFGRAGGGTNINGSWSPSANIWYHVATVRIGNTITHYIDGLSVGSGSFTDNISASTTLQIGTGGAGSLNGYIQDLRITRGYARYTANFTPPTASPRLK